MIKTKGKIGIIFSIAMVLCLALSCVFVSAKTPTVKAAGYMKVQEDGTLGKTLELVVTHTGQEIPDDEYQFKIEPGSSERADTTTGMTVSENPPMPANNVLKIKGEGRSTFEPIDFNYGGIFCYKVTEVPGTNDKMTYDNAEYDVIVYASDTGILEVVVYDNEGNKPDELRFTDTYNSQGDQDDGDDDDSDEDTDKNKDNDNNGGNNNNNNNSSDDEVSRSKAQTGDYIMIGACIALIISLFGYAVTRRRSIK